MQFQKTSCILVDEGGKTLDAVFGVMAGRVVEGEGEGSERDVDVEHAVRLGRLFDRYRFEIDRTPFEGLGEAGLNEHVDGSVPGTLLGRKQCEGIIAVEDALLHLLPKLSETFGPSR